MSSSCSSPIRYGEPEGPPAPQLKQRASQPVGGCCDELAIQRFRLEDRRRPESRGQGRRRRLGLGRALLSSGKTVEFDRSLSAFQPARPFGSRPTLKPASKEPALPNAQPGRAFHRSPSTQPEEQQGCESIHRLSPPLRSRCPDFRPISMRGSKRTTAIIE